MNENTNSNNHKQTSSYKHVKLDRQRPQLTRGNKASTNEKNNAGNNQPSQKNQNNRQDRNGQAQSGGQKGQGQGQSRSQAQGAAQGSQQKNNKQQRFSSQQSGSSRNKNNKPQQGSVKKDPNARLSIIPLGGLDAIGKNMTAFVCNNDMIIDDAGLMFPDEDHPGVDLILPDYTYVLENADKLRGIVITHGHEDHVGALPYLLKDLDRPVSIYATDLTLGLIEIKLNEFKIKNVKLVEVKPSQQIKLGCFTIDFFSVNHSIPGAVGLFIQCPAGNVLHTGDIKLDQTPVDGVQTDFRALARFGEMGVDLLLSDSTNAQKTEFTPSEKEVGKVLKQIISQASGRVIIAAFASHIHRMQQICDAATACGRKVIVAGRSMVQNTDVARQLGYLNIDDSNIIDAYEMKDLPDDQVVVMCTGSQGEPLSALSRIANGEHKTITAEEGDTVIISATPVPGNEKAVTRVINALSKLGVDVYDKSRARVHVSGHGGSEELKIILSIVKPKAFMPVHGEVMHLMAHAQLAEAVGVEHDRIFILDNGDSLVLSQSGIRRGDSVQSGIVYVDGLSVGDTSQEVLDERVALADEGFVSVSFAVSLGRKQLVGQPVIEMRGITGGDDAYLQEETQSAVLKSIRRSLNDRDMSASTVRKTVYDTVRSLLWDRTKQRPMVIVSLLEV